jgi:serine/threonine protein kinase
MLHLTTIEHGPNRYILLPYAQYSDLELFLHYGIGPGGKKKYDFDEYFPGVRNGDVTHYLLHQCWSLADAIEWLHNRITIEKTSSTVFCAHMDLKPANILIQPDPGSAVGKWMISDFGISVLKERAKPQDSEIVSIGDYISQLTMNTRPKRHEGTYQAPEVKLTETAWNESSHLTPDQKGIGRKSDIWSYGCIFSEVLAFALGGDKHVNEFHSRRKGHEGNDYFYVEKADQGYLRAQDNMLKQYQVRCSVLAWLNDLCGRQSWVDCYVETIKKILIVDTAERPDATELSKLVNHVKEHVDSKQVNCSVLQAKGEAITQRVNPPKPDTGNAVSPGNQSPPFDRIGFVVGEVRSNGDKDPRIRHSGDVSITGTVSVTSEESSGTHSSISTMSVKPADAHGIMIDSDVPRTPNIPIRGELRTPEGSKFKATSVALTYSGGKVYAAYLSESSVYFYKLDVEGMSATAEPLLKLPHPDGWEGIVIGGFFLAAWGFSSNKMVNVVLYRLLSLSANDLLYSCTFAISVTLNAR